MKKKQSKHYVTVNNKKYSYILSGADKKGVVFFECDAANISQEFLNEDIPALLFDLPELILEEKKYRAKEKDVIRFRISVEDKKIIEKKALKNGYSSVSGFLRDLAFKA